MRRTWLCLLGFAFLAGALSAAHGTVIVTTTGEEIVCEIIRETDTYLVVDHEGYRRYVLKSTIRTLDRKAGPDFGLSPRPRRFFSVSGGGVVFGSNLAAGLAGVRLGVGFPANRHVLIEGTFRASRATVESPHGFTDLYNGPIRWAGLSVGALWQFPMSRVVPLFDAGIGYYFLDHTVSDAEIARLREVFGAQSLRYSEPIGSGIGVTMGAGLIVGISRRLSLSVRTSALVIHSEFTRLYQIPNEEGLLVSAEAQHGFLLRVIQTDVGLRMYY